MSRSASRSFGSVIIFMYLQMAARLAGDERHVRRGLLQRVEHPGLGGDDDASARVLALGVLA